MKAVATTAALAAAYVALGLAYFGTRGAKAAASVNAFAERIAAWADAR